MLVAGCRSLDAGEHLIRPFLPASSIKHPATPIRDGSKMGCQKVKLFLSGPKGPRVSHPIVNQKHGNASL